MKKKEIKELRQEVEKLNAQLDKLEAREKEEVKLETGKWYTYNDILFCHTKKDGDELIGYGFGRSGTWFGDGGSWFDSERDKLREATEEEVKTALIKEAKRQGFKEEKDCPRINFSVLNSSWNPDQKLDIGDGFKFTSKNNYLRLHGCEIMINGKWAEIIEDSKVELNGYPMEVEGDIVKFGCAKFITSELKNVLDCISHMNCLKTDNGYRNIKSITLDSGVEITVEKLKEIVDALK